MKAKRPEVRIYAVEPETGAPAAARSRPARRSRSTTPARSSTAPGSRSLIPGVWEHAAELIDGAFAVPLDDAAAAIRLIAERTRVIAEGAGALAAAAALRARPAPGKVVCIVSGGNIDPRVFARILVGETP